jgi:hypothetical protein
MKTLITIKTTSVTEVIIDSRYRQDMAYGINVTLVYTWINIVSHGLVQDKLS